MFYQKIELAIEKLYCFVVTMEKLIKNNDGQMINIVCKDGHIIIAVPHLFEGDLDMDLEFEDDERDLYEYMAMRLFGLLYDKGILVNYGEDNVLYNYFWHPRLNFVVQDEPLWDLLGELVIAKMRFQQEEVLDLIDGKRRDIRMLVRRRIDKQYLRDVEEGIGNVETIFRKEYHG